MDFETAAHELYGVAPENFVETRSRLTDSARAAGDAELARRIGALRRPTLSAWAVNLLVRSAPEDVERLLQVGAELRTAWSAGGEITDLERERAALVAALVRQTGETAAVAGRPLREPYLREVEDTLQAAAVDASVAGEVQAGRLEQARSHAGFGLLGESAVPRSPVPARGTPAKPSAKTRGGKADAAGERRERERRLETAVQEASARAEEAGRALAEWESELKAAAHRLSQAEEEVTRLRKELSAAEELLVAAERSAKVARRERNRAARSAEDARRRLEEARARVK